MLVLLWQIKLTAVVILLVLSNPIHLSQAPISVLMTVITRIIDVAK